MKKNNRYTNTQERSPIRILSITSKILESSLYTNRNFTEKKILYIFQSGFRGKYSTDTCLIHLTNHIRVQKEKGKYTGW